MTKYEKRKKRRIKKKLAKDFAHAYMNDDISSRVSWEERQKMCEKELLDNFSKSDSFNDDTVYYLVTACLDRWNSDDVDRPFSDMSFFEAHGKVTDDWQAVMTLINEISARAKKRAGYRYIKIGVFQHGKEIEKLVYRYDNSRLDIFAPKVDSVHIESPDVLDQHMEHYTKKLRPYRKKVS